MKDVAIYGAGGLGREIACLLKLINKKNPQWDLIGFFDDGKKIGEKNEYGDVIGSINELNNWGKQINVIFAIGSPKIVLKLAYSISNPFVEFPNIIAPDAVFLDENNISMGKGNVICTGCLISCNVKIGDFNLFNGSVSIGHDSIIGNYNSIMPAVRISGEVKIGDENFLGVSSVILQQIHIKNRTTVGANSVVVRNTKDDLTYVGNPAIIMKY
ncbi:MAG: NeuD/PglB/VioB family sugar acetyltransferase [Mangrovibacterium sp.]